MLIENPKYTSVVCVKQLSWIEVILAPKLFYSEATML